MDPNITPGGSAVAGREGVSLGDGPTAAQIFLMVMDFP